MRLELIHPMVVGFPITFLLMGTLLRFVVFFLNEKEYYDTALKISWLIIGIGIIFGLLAVFTGEIAHDIIEDDLCEHQIVQYHQWIAVTMLFIFGISFGLDRIARWHPALVWLSLFCYVIGFISLIGTGYLGGKLVFEQGAAVEKVCKKRSS